MKYKVTIRHIDAEDRYWKDREVIIEAVRISIDEDENTLWVWPDFNQGDGYAFADMECFMIEPFGDDEEIQ